MSITSIATETAKSPSPETVGQVSGQIPIELSTRFLEHFSEQLYSSPQKAFEELISNGWDAGADCVDVRISSDLTAANATMCVLDNGSSMDEEGLRQLWRIAISPKKNKPFQYGRPVVGKFGIGKLATYVLANKLTYICKASDGVIRRVTMDYSDIDRQAAQDKLISELTLDLYKVDESEVDEALSNVYDGPAILDLIRKGVPRPEGALSEDEYGAQKVDLERPTRGTWTLVVLSNLKPTGREMKMGVLRRMLEAALPFGSEMAISLNGTLLASSKSNQPTMAEWVIGPELGIDSIEIDEEDNATTGTLAANSAAIEPVNEARTTRKAQMTKIAVTAGTLPVPHVELPGIGIVTGNIRLFETPISGGKSDERGASNGFHVNVLGRVVNQNDPSFGEKNLSHGAWACFRMTVRADGLNEFLIINREQLKELRELKIFRAFLRKVFNKARTHYDSDENAGLPCGGDVLLHSLGVLSLSPLRNVVSEALRTRPPLPDLFDETGILDKEEKRRSWRENTSDNIKNALDEVKYEHLDDDSFVKFRFADNTIVVNKDHPFVEEHSQTKAEKELVRTIAMVELLTDIYALDIGVDPSILANIREYRDRLMRFRALQRRQSGTYIAKLLLETQHDSDTHKRLEAAVSDALRYLGFHVRDLAKSGEPEGIASAYILPIPVDPTPENPHPPLYSFSFDAKSSKHDTAKTGNINLAGVVEHRKRYKANYALVVAPGFSGKAIATRCAQQKVTPMTAHDLGKLLQYTVEHGAIPLTKFREVFKLYKPSAVSKWVEDLNEWLRKQRKLTIDIFLKALKNLRGKVPDALPAGVIAFECRERLNAVSVKDADVIAVAQGLAILIPDLVGVSGDKIVVNASAERVAAAVESQIEKLHNEEPVEIKNGGGGA
jgi:hypothetical protein